MKKIILSVALLAAVGMSSCGGSESEDDKSEGGKGKMTACDCKKEAMGLKAEAEKAMGDEDKMKDLEAKKGAMKESCKDFKPEDYKDCK